MSDAKFGVEPIRGFVPAPFPRGEFVISPGELSALPAGEEMLLLDARDPEDYAEGHLPGAVNLPPSSMEWSLEIEPGLQVDHLLAPPDRIAPLLRACGVRNERPAILYDQGGSYLAARLFWILDFLGHPSPAVLDGGTAAWLLSGGTLVSEAVAPPAGDFVPRPDYDKYADFGYVIECLGRTDVSLCNALPKESFSKEAIPGSTSLPFQDTFETRKPYRLRSPGELEELLRRTASPAEEIIVYCGIGYTASQDYWVARLLGYPRVRMYDGSLTDWKVRGGPVTPGGVSLRAARWRAAGRRAANRRRGPAPG
jgi:thiosulfate/3-mercaptopyruvate sulfurtransferase